MIKNKIYKFSFLSKFFDGLYDFRSFMATDLIDHNFTHVEKLKYKKKSKINKERKRKRKAKIRKIFKNLSKKRKKIMEAIKKRKRKAIMLSRNLFFKNPVKIEVYSLRLKKFIRVFRKNSKKGVFSRKGWKICKYIEFLWLRQFAFSQSKKLLTFIFNISETLWFLNFPFFFLPSHYIFIFRYFFFVKKDKLIYEKKNLRFILKKNKIKINKKKLNVDFFKLKKSTFRSKDFSFINKWILNWFFSKFIFLKDFVSIKKNKKKIKIFKKSNFNFFFIWRFNSRWSYPFRFYRKKSFKKSLDLRFLYLKLWQIIKEKKFKLNMPFLFLDPNFVKKTFFSNKSIFVKFINFNNFFFNKKPLIFKDLLLKKGLLKLMNFKLITFKRFYFNKIKSFKSYKLVNISKNNAKFFPILYEMLFIKIH